MMLLSSVNRLIRYTELKQAAIDVRRPGGANANLAELNSFLVSVSQNIARWCNRDFQLKSCTDYFDYTPERLELFLRDVPAVSIDQIDTDGTSQFNGNESLLDPSQYALGKLNTSVVLLYPIYFIYFWRKKTMRVKYTAGLASHPVNSVFTATITGSPTIGHFASADLSGAGGLVKAATGTTITIENLFGAFQVGDTVTFAASEGGNADDGVSAVITAITSQSLAEAYPELTTACEMEVMFLQKHKKDAENMSTQKDGTRRYYGTKKEVAGLQPNTQTMLQPYRRIWLGV